MKKLLILITALFAVLCFTVTASAFSARHRGYSGRPDRFKHHTLPIQKEFRTEYPEMKGWVESFPSKKYIERNQGGNYDERKRMDAR